MAIPAALVSFIVTFYNQNAWQKYWTCYTLTQHLRGQIFDFTLYLGTYFERAPAEGGGASPDTLEEPAVFGGIHGVTPLELEQTKWELNRLIHLVHHRFYAQLKEDGTHKTMFEIGDCIKEEEIHVPEANGSRPKGAVTTLATKQEKAILEKLPLGTQHLVCIKWCMDKCNVACDKRYITRRHLERLELKLESIREDMGKVSTQVSQPLPLAYYYSVVFLTIATFTGYAYGAAQNDIRISWLPLVIYTLGLTGILEVSRQLSMPFGSDDVDLKPKEYFDSAMQRSYELMTEFDVNSVLAGAHQVDTEVMDDTIIEGAADGGDEPLLTTSGAGGKNANYQSGS